MIAHGKFLALGGARFLVKGVSYGTFAPDSVGRQFPPEAQIARDFAQMAPLGVNTVRIYTPPPPELLDEAVRHDLQVMVGLPWSQHTAFLDDRRTSRRIQREIVARVRELRDHPAASLFALGNEIPAGVVRWHGRRRVERFLEELYRGAKDASPESLFTYVNYPPTEFLDLPFLDVCAFNVFLHERTAMRGYLARMQNIAGNRPLLLAECGADSRREGERVQAAITAMQVRAAFEEGACGAIAFAWTDEWWRGGEAVEDWAFGLVDRARAPKPAAAAVAEAFAEGAFPAAGRATWPRVSVVVCAYNAAEFLEECLTSLERLDYPDFEILLVNDGSGDRTGDVARGHAGVRTIDTPNRGLAAARNEGLAAATGTIVAYTDADAFVESDWLSHLIQPLLESDDVVGCGGPNAVPPTDPPMAQCVARAPGGPTHVLLDDRVAEHVPGCNMAFRRDALLEIGGFNPTYRRAGDDVDICWRLQARGGRIGFAAAAMVWHHHRASVRGYWRQQVGYGEGETWLMAQHPEKFLEGRALWRGRIYSPLPFVRSLSETRVNTGVWGTAAFPSVYRVDGHPLAFLPHTLRWQGLSLALLGIGVLSAALAGASITTTLLIAAGLAGLSVTLAKNATHALRSNIGSLSGSRMRYRITIAFLHFLQPLARGWGRVRGSLTPPELAQARSSHRTGQGSSPSLRDWGRAALLVFGSVLDSRYWSEKWTSSERILPRLTDGIRSSRPARTVVLDEGWSDDRDLSVLVGPWAWLDLRALVEEHEGGRCLIRMGTTLRPTPLGVTAALGLGAVATGTVIVGVILAWPVVGAAAALGTFAVGFFGLLQAAQAAGVVRRGVERMASTAGMVPLPARPGPTPFRAPSRLRVYGLRAAVATAAVILWLGVGTQFRRDTAIAEVAPVGSRPAREGPVLSVWLDTPGGVAVDASGDIYFADSQSSVIRRIDGRTFAITPVAGNQVLGSGFVGDDGPAIAAMLDEPDGVAIAPDGDVIIADSQNHRIRRVDRETGVITTIAGSGDATFDGDGKPALATALDQPSAVASAPNGDIYIADTMNNRIRMIENATGIIRTVAGNGQVSEGGPVGDGGPATDALLYMPSDVAIAFDGSLYIADMHHNRVRRVDSRTGVITTVAGDGLFGNAPDGVPATGGSLAGPSGIALMGDGPDLTLFIADSYNAVVRVVGPDGVMRIVSGGSVVFGAPSRVAFAPARGWLYVADSMEARLVALAIRQPSTAPDLLAPPPPATAGEGTGP